MDEWDSVFISPVKSSASDDSFVTVNDEDVEIANNIAIALDEQPTTSVSGEPRNKDDETREEFNEATGDVTKCGELTERSKDATGRCVSPVQALPVGADRPAFKTLAVNVKKQRKDERVKELKKTKELPVLTAAYDGPLRRLENWTKRGKRVRVFSRGVATVCRCACGVVLAFDKHWNVILSNVTEVWRRPARVKQPGREVLDAVPLLNYSKITADEAEKITGVKWTVSRREALLSRNLEQLLITGSNIESQLMSEEVECDAVVDSDCVLLDTKNEANSKLIEVDAVDSCMDEPSKCDDSSTCDDLNTSIVSSIVTNPEANRVQGLLDGASPARLRQVELLLKAPRKSCRLVEKFMTSLDDGESENDVGAQSQQSTFNSPKPQSSQESPQTLGASHPKAQSTPKMQPVMCQMFQCPLCRKRFTRALTLQSHTCKGAGSTSKRPITTDTSPLSSTASSSAVSSPATPLTCSNKTPKRAKLDLEALKKREERLAASARKKAEDEAKRKLREEEKQRKAEEKAKLAEEKEKQRKQREEERLKQCEEKERQRKLKEEEKQKYMLEKEEERKRKLQEDEKKRLEKEEADRRKREEEEKVLKKKEKMAEKFKNFFTPSSKKPEDGHDTSNSSNNASSSLFRPLYMKKHMSVAPMLRREPLSEDAKTALDAALEASDVQISLESMLHRWKTLRCSDRRRSGGSTDETQTIGRPKLLQFHENYRPPYYGTWRNRTKCVNGRRPFAKDTALRDYTVDSDDEWEDEPMDGDECRSDDEEEDRGEDEGDDGEGEDDQFIVDHGYLSDGEGEDEEKEDPEARRIRQQIDAKAWGDKVKKRKVEKLKPLCIGPALVQSGSGRVTGMDAPLLDVLRRFAVIGLGGRTVLTLSESGRLITG